MLTLAVAAVAVALAARGTAAQLLTGVGNHVERNWATPVARVWQPHEVCADPPCIVYAGAVVFVAIEIDDAFDRPVEVELFCRNRVLGPDDPVFGWKSERTLGSLAPDPEFVAGVVDQLRLFAVRLPQFTVCEEVHVLVDAPDDFLSGLTHISYWGTLELYKSFNTFSLLTLPCLDGARGCSCSTTLCSSDDTECVLVFAGTTAIDGPAAGLEDARCVSRGTFTPSLPKYFHGDGDSAPRPTLPCIERRNCEACKALNQGRNSVAQRCAWCADQKCHEALTCAGWPESPVVACETAEPSSTPVPGVPGVPSAPSPHGSPCLIGDAPGQCLNVALCNASPTVSLCGSEADVGCCPLSATPAPLPSPSGDPLAATTTLSGAGTGTPQQAPAAAEETPSSSLVPIIGGAVGGICALALVGAVVAFFVLARRRRPAGEGIDMPNAAADARDSYTAAPVPPVQNYDQQSRGSSYDAGYGLAPAPNSLDYRATIEYTDGESIVQCPHCGKLYDAIDLPMHVEKRH